MLPISVADMRQAARRRLPHMIFEYVDGGSGNEQTAGANIADFGKVELLQRALVDVSARDLSTTVLGQKLAMPLIIAPTGFAGLVARNGEQIGAQAAEAAGIAFWQSTVSINSLEEVRSAVQQPHWFQLYFFQDRGIANDLIARAAAAACPVLALTVDGSPQGRRDRDLRAGFITASSITPRMMLDFALHPRWTLDMAKGPRPVFGNFTDLPGVANEIIAQAYFIARQTDLTVTWKDLDWLRARWKGKLVVKGIMEPEDARLAADHGADGIVVTNHGGRQLDGARSTISALPAIVDAVGDRLEVLMDGGIRRGQDVVKALALGARACLIGRPWLYGLGAAGEAGVAGVLDILRQDMATAMAFMGVTSVGQLRGNAAVARARFD